MSKRKIMDHIYNYKIHKSKRKNMDKHEEICRNIIFYTIHTILLTILCKIGMG
jgi:hypothetical protein